MKVVSKIIKMNGKDTIFNFTIKNSMINILYFILRLKKQLITRTSSELYTLKLYRAYRDKNSQRFSNLMKKQKNQQLNI